MSRCYRHLGPEVGHGRPTFAPASLLLGGLSPLFPNIRIVIADGGHQSRRLTRELLKQAGWTLQIVKRRQRKFKITGLTWIVECSFAWLSRNRRKDLRVPSAELRDALFKTLLNRAF